MNTTFKTILRKHHYQLMAKLGTQEREKMDLQICDHFKRHISLPNHAVIAGYSPIKNECSPLPILEDLVRYQHVLALPAILGKGKPLVFRAWCPGDAMDVGEYGILEPRNDAPLVNPSVLAVPMVGFDVNGYRLGHGGGFYDRTIEMIRKHQSLLCIGIAYHFQQIERLPAEAHDCRMDYIVTDKEVLAFS